MRFRLRTLLIVLAVSAVVGCGPAIPQKLTLYSIDGRYEAGEGPKTAETFRGYPVLGKVEITDALVSESPGLADQYS